MKTIFTKYSNERNPLFCIKTNIVKHINGQLEVFKFPARPEAKPHIQKMLEYSEKINRYYKNGGFRSAKIRQRGDGVAFEYAEGITLEQLLEKLYEDNKPELLLKTINDFKNRLMRCESVKPFVRTAEFDSIFGKTPVPANLHAMDFCCYDLAFSNIIESNNELCIIDYEWCFDFPVPIEFILYRAIKLYITLNGKADLIQKDIYSFLGYNIKAIEVWEQLEKSFQEYVHENAFLTRDLYDKYRGRNYKTADILQQPEDKTIVCHSQVYLDYGNGFSEKDSYRTNLESGQKTDLKISITDKVKIVRFDPEDESCIMSIDEISAYHTDGIYTPEYSSNGCISHNVIYFNTPDPQILFKRLKMGTNAIRIRYSVVKVDGMITDALARAIFDKLENKFELKNLRELADLNKKTIIELRTKLNESAENTAPINISGEQESSPEASPQNKNKGNAMPVEVNKAANNMNEIKRQIESAEIVSFDIFDTLILRLCARATDIFRIMEHITGICGFAKMREEFQTKCSIEVENTRKEPHAVFDDIYDYIEKNCTLDLNGYKTEELRQLELKIENTLLVRNSEVYSLYKFAKNIGKRVIAVSDMYLGKKEIVPILQHCGYKELDEVYVSADVKKTKYRLDLFDHVADSEKTEPKNILHIGDNYTDDYENAKKQGFCAIHYNTYKRKEILPLYQSISAGISNSIKNNGSFWYSLGAEIGGPLYCGFIDKIKERISELKPDKLFFLSRDGYNLFHIFKNLGLIDIDFEYLYTSRRAMLLCGINKLDDEVLSLLPPYTVGQTAKEVLDYLDFGEVSESSVKTCGFSGFDAVISEPSDIEKFKKIYFIEEKLLLEKAAEERASFQKYLEKINFFGCSALIFDCGWNGSSQYLLDRALRLMDCTPGENSFIYAGLLNSEKCRHQLNGKQYKAMLFDQEKNNALYERLSRSIIILELFFGAPHRSVWKYADNGQGYIEENIENEYLYKKEILNGITDFIKTAYPLFSELGISASAQDSLSNVFRLIEQPTDEEAVKIGNLENLDGFVSSSGSKKYIAWLTPDDIKKPLNELYWPQGIYVRNDIDEEVKLYVENITGIKKPALIQTDTEKEQTGIVRRGFSYINRYGIITTAYRINEKLKKRHEKTPYEHFAALCDKDILNTTQLKYKPLISFVVPVYNVLDYQLKKCIDSILNQTYDNYELILVDDNSTWKNVRKTLSMYESNPKIKVIYRKENGHISRSTNTGIKAAKGEYIAFADCDDVIAPNAVYEITKLLNEDKTLDFIYSDEDKLTEDGKIRHFPHFKPDWSPDTFASLMYTSHLSVYRRHIVNEIGGLRTGFEGSQDYEFTMRFTEKTNRIGHIPKVLYYWRQRPESTASDLNNKPYVMDAMLNLKTEMLKRRAIDGSVELIPDIHQYRVIYNPPKNALVSIIIPSKDNYDMLKQCLASIIEKTAFKHYEIIVVDNGSNKPNQKSYEKLLKDKGASYIYEKAPFNFSKMCNIGAAAAKGDYLLFLNDDIEADSPQWLERMVGHASQKHSGAVGAKLLYPNTSLIQHCGVLNLKMPTGPSHALWHLDDTPPHYFCRNKTEYNYIAVTAACLCIKKSKFNEIGGFDEDLKIAYNDIDLCFKLYEHGYYNVVRNDAVLYHHESYSRGLDDNSPEKQKRLWEEYELLQKKHPVLINKDPFYNINFAPDKLDFSVDYYRIKKTASITSAGVNIEPFISERVQCVLDTISQSDKIMISGWAFIANMPFNNLNSKKIILLDENNKALLFSTEIMYRPDVAASYNSKGLALCGFSCLIDSTALAEGKYRIGVLLKNTLTLKKQAALFNNYINI